MQSQGLDSMTSVGLIKLRVFYEFSEILLLALHSSFCNCMAGSERELLAIYKIYLNLGACLL